ncbi:LuxR C-terminal-related transcriptional regulator [Qipengyuania sp. G39]|uniref:LuxR C-terminal-related transcriptional regulator n=1 Tax=Qipengyuania profundimaris TaxID=3067652 RepID=A0ABT9HRL5_9SPHN|nr:LuxR C-terminal-related transcriptional regulator [Qipengyuania sp. G39]MDP4575791.1 LuxR C-terminal-related transcriptional regulator [Qipengyuania sp. G39]
MKTRSSLEARAKAQQNGAVMKAHVIDPDIGRRGKLARRFFELGHHAEVFESPEEFLRFGPEFGYVFAYDNSTEHSAADSSPGASVCDSGLPVVMYSDDPDLERVVKAMVAGALDYLRWPIDGEKVDQLIADVTARENIRAREEGIRKDARAKIDLLSKRERETLALITRGLGNKAIAQELSISHRTVEIHRSNAFEKINAASTADAVRIGVHAGLDRD